MHSTINIEVFRLNRLEYLDLLQNYVTRILSAYVGILLLLNKFHLNKNYLKGNIPTELCQLYNSQDFHINNNSFTRKVLLFTSSLYSLDVSCNLLDSTLPSLKTMTSLKYLSASENMLNSVRVFKSGKKVFKS